MEPFQSFCDKIGRNQVLSTGNFVSEASTDEQGNCPRNTGGPYGVCGFFIQAATRRQYCAKFHATCPKNFPEKAGL